MKSLLSNETAVSCRVGGEMKHMRNFGIKRVDKGQTNTAKGYKVRAFALRQSEGRRANALNVRFVISYGLSSTPINSFC